MKGDSVYILSHMHNYKALQGDYKVKYLMTVWIISKIKYILFREITTNL